MILDSAIFPSSGGGGSTATIWVSGQTVSQWEWKISPADGELYQRITAAGGGSIDPADDGINYLARSYRRTTTLTSGNTVVVNSLTSAGNFMNGSSITTVAISAGTRTAVISTTGKGVVKFLGFLNVPAVSRPRRIEVIVDGRTIWDNTVTFSVAGHSIAPIGSLGVAWNATQGMQAAYSAQPTDSIQFKRNFSVYITPTNADTSGEFQVGRIVEITN